MFKNDWVKNFYYEKKIKSNKQQIISIIFIFNIFFLIGDWTQGCDVLYIWKDIKLNINQFTIPLLKDWKNF